MHLLPAQARTFQFFDAQNTALLSHNCVVTRPYKPDFSGFRAPRTSPGRYTAALWFYQR